MEIVGEGTTDQINHVYTVGGMDMSVKMVENLLNVPADYKRINGERNMMNSVWYYIVSDQTGENRKGCWII